MNAEKLYFDVIITNNTYHITESSSKPKGESALSVLLKIESVLKKQIKYGATDDLYSAYSDRNLGKLLLEKAKLICHSSLLKTKRDNSWIKAVTKRIYFLIYPAKTFNLSIEVILQILSNLSISSLLTFGMVNREARTLAYDSLPRIAAAEYGFDIERHGCPISYLKEWADQMIKLSSFFRDMPTFKPCVYHNVSTQSINFEESLNNFKNLTLKEKIYIFSMKKFSLEAYPHLAPFLVGNIITNDESSENGSETHLLELLLEEKLDPNTRDPKKRTLLQRFSLFGNVRMVELLINCKAQINSINKIYNCTALHFACTGPFITESHIRIVKLLLEAGAVKDVVDIWGNTPLDLATINAHQELIDLLKN